MESRLSPVSIVLSGWESLTPTGWDINPSQVSSQQTLVFFYLPRKDGKPSSLRQKRKSHKSVQTLAEPGIELGTLWSEGRDLTNCANCNLWIMLFTNFITRRLRFRHLLQKRQDKRSKHFVEEFTHSMSRNIAVVNFQFNVLGNTKSINTVLSLLFINLRKRKFSLSKPKSCWKWVTYKWHCFECRLVWALLKIGYWPANRMNYRVKERMWRPW